MRASLAYFQGKFNNCTFAWESGTKCKITVLDSVDGLKGSFVAEYKDNVMVNIESDDEMKPTQRSIPQPPDPPELSK